MRVLTACYEEKTEACTEAVSVLRSPLWLLAGYSVMDVASEAHLMYFLSHPACQEAATKLWSGAIDPSVPAWRVRVRPAPSRPAPPHSTPSGPAPLHPVFTARSSSDLCRPLVVESANKEDNDN